MSKFSSHNNVYRQNTNVVKLERRQPQSKIVCGDDLLVWMWNRFKESEPQVAVEDDIISGLECILGQLQEGYIGHRLPIDFNDLFSGICWDDIYSHEGNRCSIDFLKMVGQLISFIQRDGSGAVSKIRICELMLIFWEDADRYLCRKTIKGTGHLVSTAACEKEFDVLVSVEACRYPLNEHWQTLKPD